MSSLPPRGASVLAVALVLAGCVGALPGGRDDADGRPSVCADATVAFSAVSDYYWEPNLVRIGSALPPSSHVFLVVFENDTALGIRNESTGPDPGHGDAGIIWLDGNLTGNHTVRVDMYVDADGDGQFARDVDHLCRNERGDVVRAGPRTFNFSAFAGNRSWRRS